MWLMQDLVARLAEFGFFDQTLAVEYASSMAGFDEPRQGLIETPVHAWIQKPRSSPAEVLCDAFDIWLFFRGLESRSFLYDYYKLISLPPDPSGC